MESKRISAAILAHVDAGKTTLSEALLYVSGSIQKAGRVDNGDTFLDTDTLERARGITIFSKQAVLQLGDMQLTLLDTPGHVDFSAEMERTLQVPDYAILVISGADGVQGHTKTLWRLLKRYGIPVFLFINKMDQPGTDKSVLLAELKRELDTDCIDFTEPDTASFWEDAAMCDEQILEHFLEEGMVGQQEIIRLIKERKLFPCYFGSALKLEGVKALLTGLHTYTRQPDYPEEFGARVFKIARDTQGNRLTYLKITGGNLKVRQQLFGYGIKGTGRETDNRLWEEKVNQIRIYSGEKYETAEAADAGCICAVTGLTKTFPGEGLGMEEVDGIPLLAPVITYRIDLPEGMDAAVALQKLRLLEEEEPELHIVWNETLQEIQAQLMGEVQMEILKSLILERFGFAAAFGPGNIVYKETISNTVEGVGHFEPLRHYAEVHLILEPGEPGSGMQFAAACSEEVLDKNWQRLVLTHLEEKEHTGVLCGAPLADMKITLAGGRAHQKHTEGGDFRQATYRAVRQGLMEAESVLLEPYYDFRLEVPEIMVGRAMTDIERMHGTLYGTVESGGGMSVLKGHAPVASMQDYQKEVLAYTKGHGRFHVTLGGYWPCHNTEEVLERISYDPKRDTLNPSGSVFCAHGAGFVVGWEQVKAYMHMDSCMNQIPDEKEPDEMTEKQHQNGSAEKERWIGTDEIDRILEQTYNANKRNKLVPAKNSWKLRGHGNAGDTGYREPAASSVTRTFQTKRAEKEYLLVDGYNVIFAWEDLSALAKVSIDGARGKLMDILSNYQGIRGCELIVVFDAYRVEGHRTEILQYHNIHVVYTKEAETADQYIEKFAHENGGKYRVTVATSDGLEQIIIRGAGCSLLSARDLEQEVIRENIRIQEAYQGQQESSRSYLFDSIDEKNFRISEQTD